MPQKQNRIKNGVNININNSNSMLAMADSIIGHLERRIQQFLEMLCTQHLCFHLWNSLVHQPFNFQLF